MNESLTEYLSSLHNDLNDMQIGMQNYELDKMHFPVIAYQGGFKNADAFLRKFKDEMDYLVEKGVEWAYSSHAPSIIDAFQSKEISEILSYFEDILFEVLGNRQFLIGNEKVDLRKKYIIGGNKMENSLFLKRIAQRYCATNLEQIDSLSDFQNITNEKYNRTFMYYLKFLLWAIELRCFKHIMNDMDYIPIYIEINNDTKDDYLEHFVYNSLKKYYNNINENDPFCAFDQKPVCFIVNDVRSRLNDIKSSLSLTIEFKKLSESLNKYCNENKNTLVWSSLVLDYPIRPFNRLSLSPILSKKWLFLYSYQWTFYENEDLGKIHPETINKTLYNNDFLIDILSSNQDIVGLYRNLLDSTESSPDKIVDDCIRNRLGTNNENYIYSLYNLLEFIALEMGKNCSDIYHWGLPENDNVIENIDLFFDDAFSIDAFNCDSYIQSGNVFTILDLCIRVLFECRILKPHVSLGYQSTVTSTGNPRIMYYIEFESSIIQQYFLARAIAKNKKRDLFSINQILTTAPGHSHRYMLLFLFSLLNKDFDKRMFDRNYSNRIIDSLMKLPSSFKTYYIRALIGSRIDLNLQQIKDINSFILFENENRDHELECKVFLSNNRNCFCYSLISLCDTYKANSWFCFVEEIKKEFIKNHFFGYYIEFIKELVHTENNSEYIKQGKSFLALDAALLFYDNYKNSFIEFLLDTVPHLSSFNDSASSNLERIKSLQKNDEFIAILHHISSSDACWG